MKNLLLLSLTMLPFTHLATAQPTELTGDEILAKSAKTYRELKAFRGDSKVTSSSTISIKGAAPQTSERSAQASFNFQRGAFFIIKGLDTGGGPFSIDNWGTKTTMTTNFTGKETTENVEDVEMGVAGMTGVAAGAPTTIPALLLDSNWGYPYRTKGSIAKLEGHETLQGHDCYKVSQPLSQLNSVSTFWIDSQSFLLRQMKERAGEQIWSEAQLKEMPEMRDFKQLSSETTHVFTIAP
jgi:hypothetical protein